MENLEFSNLETLKWVYKGSNNKPNFDALLNKERFDYLKNLKKYLKNHWIIQLRIHQFSISENVRTWRFRIVPKCNEAILLANFLTNVIFSQWNGFISLRLNTEPEHGQSHGLFHVVWFEINDALYFIQEIVNREQSGA